MGSLTKFDLDDFGCDAYVETGIGRCVSFNRAALRYGQEHCYGVDLDYDFFNEARQKYPDSTFIYGKSTKGLEIILQDTRIKQTDRVLFFLDAHFPGADYRGRPYDPEAQDALPLREELLLIKRFRPDCDDVIICDDARIYYQGAFANGNISYRADHGIEDVFPERDFTIDYRDEGYIIIKKKMIPES